MSLSRATRRTARIGLDVLECRAVPAMLLDAAGTLSLTGTAAPDNVHVKILADAQVTTIQVVHKVNNVVVEAKNFLVSKVKLIAFDGGLGNDVFYNQTNLKTFAQGGVGDDKLTSLGGSDTLVGGDGKDTLSAGAGKDVLSGLAGDDTLVGGDGDDVLNGGLGKDDMSGGAGNDAMNGDASPAGGEFTEADKMFGGDGDDVMQGMAGIDLIHGDAGNDKLYAASVNFTNADEGGSMYGGAGNDLLVFPLLGEHFGDGGADNDVLVGGNEKDNLYGGSGADTIYGNGGDDYIVSGSNDITDGADVVYAGDGDDTVQCGAGNDLVLGGNGDDMIAGGTGDDTLDGGDGADKFAGDAGTDTIKVGQNDGDEDFVLADVFDDLMHLGQEDEVQF